MIIEYKLHPVPYRGKKIMKIPDFVTDGGHWGNPDDHTLIGSVPEGAEYYVPDTVITYTLAELQTRQLAIHTKYPMRNLEEDRVLTNDEVNAEVAAWVSARE
jgi:hypothetical protein